MKDSQTGRDEERPKKNNEKNLKINKLNTNMLFSIM